MPTNFTAAFNYITSKYIDIYIANNCSKQQTNSVPRNTPAFQFPLFKYRIKMQVHAKFYISRQYMTPMKAKSLTKQSSVAMWFYVTDSLLGYRDADRLALGIVHSIRCLDVHEHDHTKK